MKPRYRVIYRNGIGILQARRRPFLLVIPRWQTLAIGEPEDLQRCCCRLQALLGQLPLLPRRIA